MRKINDFFVYKMPKDKQLKVVDIEYTTEDSDNNSSKQNTSINKHEIIKIVKFFIYGLLIGIVISDTKYIPEQFVDILFAILIIALCISVVYRLIVVILTALGIHIGKEKLD